MKPEVREVFYSEEYLEYYNSLDERTKEKYDYVVQIIRTQYVVNKKFVKNLKEAEFYEARISVGNNEHRTLLFAIDNDNFIEAKRVILLNSFLKKDSKQYRSEIKKARSIVQKYV